MTDINAALLAKAAAAGNRTRPVSPVHQQAASAGAVRLIELLFFAYRDFTGGADAVLEEYGFGRAHHRVLHFVNRNPGLTVADLLAILKITKQSLARVLKTLIDDGFITQRSAPSDRRKRRLFVTKTGADLAGRLLALQVERIGHALASTGEGGQEDVATFLMNVIDATEQPAVRRIITGERDG